MNKNKGYIFDLDGVIVFTDKLHYKAWKQAVDKRRIPFDEQVNNKLRGVSRSDSLDILLKEAGVTLSEEEKSEILVEKNDIYKGLLASMTCDDVSKDVRDSLERLKAFGCKIAIGSSSRNTKTILKQVGLIEIFDAIADGNDIEKSKPDPEVFLVAARKLNLKPEDCIVLEDAYAGIDAAKAGHMTAVGIGDAAGYDKADYHIEKFSEIENIG